jgi:hypothetical protein
MTSWTAIRVPVRGEERRPAELCVRSARAEGESWTTSARSAFGFFRGSYIHLFGLPRTRPNASGSYSMFWQTAKRDL